jgi:hypothetical protein
MLNKLSNGHEPGKHEDNNRARVVIACLLTAAGFFSAVGPILVISGEWALDNGTVRYVVTVGGTVLVIALLLAAVYVQQPPRRDSAACPGTSSRCQSGKPPHRRRRRHLEAGRAPRLRSPQRRP